MTLRGLGPWRHDAIFTMNFELSLSLWTNWTLHVAIAHAVCDAEEYLQGPYERFVDHLVYPACISATVFMSRYDYQSLCHDAKGEGVQDLTS